MNIFKVRKFILSNLFLFNLINFSYQVQSSVLHKKYTEIDNLINFNLSNFSKEKKDNHIFEVTHEIASEVKFNQKFQLEIQSEKQYQQDSILYAEGNVIVIYRGNTLKADAL